MFNSKSKGVAPKLTISVTFFVVMVFIKPVIAQSQNTVGLSELDQRLQRVERVLDNRVLLDMLQRIESLLAEVRQLRGEVERVDYELKSMGKRQRDLYLDIDRRLQTLESGGNLAGGGLNTLTLEQQLSLLESGQSPGQAIDSISTAPEILSGVNSDGPPATRSLEKEGEKELYTKAYDILMAGDNDSAIDAFVQFLKEFPLGPYSDNAQYWQGEANYVSRRFDKAVESFNMVVKNFPDSVKVPDAKLKIAFALFEQGELGESRIALARLVEEHPGTSAQRLATKRLKSMAANDN